MPQKYTEMSTWIKAGITGGTGYTAGELIPLLLHHPNVELLFVQSHSEAGKKITSIHPELTGRTDMTFEAKLDHDLDVLFICSGHGNTEGVLKTLNVSPDTRLIDLSADFRHHGNHTFVYGLPEWNRDKIQKSQNIANPGCFATAIQLGILPLSANGLLQDDIHITAITGSTGAGKTHSSSTHFTWRHGNASAYKVFQHQHEIEIMETIQEGQPDYQNQLLFTPVRGTFTRGILCTQYTKSDLEEDAIKEVFASFYHTHPFVHMLEKAPDVKQVVNTNNCFLHVTKKRRYVYITSVIDNLMKGASGQAVQNMNILFGINEGEGLVHLKPVKF